MPLPINNLVEIFAFFMLMMGLLVSVSNTIQRMLLYYKYQCAGLALVTLFTAVEQPSIRLRIVSGLFVIIPVLLALYIEPLLAQATVTEDFSVWRRLVGSFNWSMRSKMRQQALPAWLQKRHTRRGTLTLLAIDLGLVAAAFITAFTLLGMASPGVVQPNGQVINSLVGIAAGEEMVKISALVLAAAFSLLLLGLSTMVNTEDIISQVTGLLVMEQGMFLAAAGCLPRNEIRIAFVLGLLLYTIITLTILVFLLPELHHQSGSLKIEQQTQLKG